MAEIHLANVGHSYEKKPASLDDYAVRPMEMVWEDGGAYALLGPWGCGKTTLLNIISGLLTPTQGRVLFDGQDVTHLPPEKRNIAQVFQFPVLYDTMTVFDNLAFPLRNRGVDESQVRRRVHEIAELLDLTRALKRRASGLSADAKQKISLGRGLVRSDVAAILFDEPLTVIDPHMKWLLRSKLKEIHQQFKLTLIYVTHDQTEALTFADQVVVMHEGAVVQIGTPQELFEKPRHTFVGYFIGSPGMNLIPVRLEGDALVTDSTPIPVDPAAIQRLSGREKLTVGIRPEFLGYSPAPQPNGVPARIQRVENLGTFKIAVAQVGEQTVKAKIPEKQPISPGDGWLIFPPEQTLLYQNDEMV